jgi:hypothetical protein
MGKQCQYNSNKVGGLIMKQKILWFIAGTVVAVISLMISNNVVYGQSSGNLTSQTVFEEWVKIISPIEGQQVPVGKELLVSGESSDNISKNCTVSVIANNIKPYQNAYPSGADGPNDHSKWSFTLSSNYTDVKEGPNRITAKLSCPQPTRWYSVNAIGVPTGQASTNVSSANLTPSVLSATNESGAVMLSPPSEQQQPTRPSTSSEVTSQPAISVENNRTMSVIFDILNNPVPRESDQNITMIVSDAASNEKIAGGSITGKLLYPGGNYIKDFTGTTDSDGQFVYSWTIGENGDAGQLTIEVQVAAPGYESQAATSGFQITEG